MLDDPDGQAKVLADLLDELQQIANLARVHPGCRLIEQKHARLRGQRPGDLHPSLGTIGQVLGQLLCLPLQPEHGQQLHGPFLDLPLLLPITRAMEDHVQQAVFDARGMSDTDIVQHSQLVPQANGLKSAPNAFGRDLMGSRAN